MSMEKIHLGTPPKGTGGDRLREANRKINENFTQLDERVTQNETSIQKVQLLPGPKGESGDQGPQGIKGDKGETGAVGPSGSQGSQGIQGIKGDKGDRGEAGEQGLQGVKGDQGIQGVSGETGQPGPVGPKGATGDAGPIGLTGAKGDRGDDGPAGPQGPKGDTGSTGPSGVTNVTGLIQAGTNVTITGAGTQASPFIVSSQQMGAASTSNAGSMSAGDKKKVNQIQAVIATTTAAGNYTWTFPVPFDSIPAVTLTPVETPATTTVFNHKITAISTTAVTVSVTRATPVTVLSISVLGVSAAGSTPIHLIAVPQP